MVPTIETATAKVSTGLQELIDIDHDAAKSVAVGVLVSMIEAMMKWHELDHTARITIEGGEGQRNITLHAYE